VTFGENTKEGKAEKKSDNSGCWYAMLA